MGIVEGSHPGAGNPPISPITLMAYMPPRGSRARERTKISALVDRLPSCLVLRGENAVWRLRIQELLASAEGLASRQVHICNTIDASISVKGDSKKTRASMNPHARGELSEINFSAV